MWAVSKGQSGKGLSIDGQCGQLVRDSEKGFSKRQSEMGLSIDGQCGQLVRRVSVIMDSVGS